MTGIIKTKEYLKSVLNAEFLGTTNVPTKARIGTGTTDPTEDDTTLETQQPTDGGSTYDISFQTNYPSVNESTVSAEIRFRLGTTDANSLLLTECATFDAANTMKDRATHSSISKTSADIAIFSIKTKHRNIQQT